MGAYIAEILVGEDEGDIAFQLISKGEQSRVLVLLAELLDHESDHGVLADEHLSLAAHGHADLHARQTKFSRGEGWRLW